MEMKYDPDADAAYIRVKKGKFHHTKKLDDNTILDLDKDGNVLGIELLFVKETNPLLAKELIKSASAV